MIQFLQKIYDKRNDFDFDIVNFPFLDGDVPRCPFLVFIYLNLFCNKVFLIQNSMEIWYTNLRKSLEIQTSLLFSNVLLTV